MNQHFGEIISLIVAVSWTLTALSFEYASKKVGSLSLNIIRLIMAMVMLGIFLLAVTGSPFPVNAGGAAWLWLALSGLVGYVFGDFCLFNSYVVIGSRLGQLFMTLAPPTAAIAGLAGFLIIMFLQKKGRSLLASFKDVKSMGAAATGTFFGPFLGVSLSLLAVNYTEAGIASTIMALTPILIILPSKLIYKEKVTARQVIGAVISVTGASLFFI